MYWNQSISNCTLRILLLNSNIRCIEIKPHTHLYQNHHRWIVTLDVLKWLKGNLKFKHPLGWIVTLDVLKCIRGSKKEVGNQRWIVTLDVLKFALIIYLIKTGQVE